MNSWLAGKPHSPWDILVIFKSVLNYFAIQASVDIHSVVMRGYFPQKSQKCLFKGFFCFSLLHAIVLQEGGACSQRAHPFSSTTARSIPGQLCKPQLQIKLFELRVVIIIYISNLGPIYVLLARAGAILAIGCSGRQTTLCTNQKWFLIEK